MRVALARPVPIRIEAVEAVQVVPRLGMVLPEPPAQVVPVAAAGAVAGVQVGAFIAAVGLGLTAVRMAFLQVRQGLTQMAGRLPAIGLTPSRTHCCACVTG